MKGKTGWMLLAVGAAAGLAGGWLLFAPTNPAHAAADRNGETVVCTGPISVGGLGHDFEGVWLLDYRSGKLLAGVIQKQDAKIAAWADVSLASEFNLTPASEPKFVMTTGMAGKGASVLYLAEATTGKMGVYSMTLVDVVKGTVTIRRHDMSSFRPK
jgi:hypothetical protein